MKGKNVILVLMGAEFFPLFRLMPGRVVALLVFTSLGIKNLIYQFIRIPPPYGVLLRVAAALSALYALIGLFSRKPDFDGGFPLLRVFGSSRRKAYLAGEPLLAAIIALALVVPYMSLPKRETTNDLMQKNLPKGPLSQSTASRPEGIAPFVPLWDALGLNDGITAAPAYVTPGEAAVRGMVLLFIAWLGFALHAKTCDWPESGEYREMLRQERHPGSGGTTFYSSGEPDD